MSVGQFTAFEPLQMFELRVLSGLHQGAALPLLGEQWSIGADDEADLALYDPGIAPRHAQLQVSHGHWSVQAQEGLVQDETGAVLARIAHLALNREFSVGGVRLCVSSADRAWPLEAAPVSEALPGHPVSQPAVAQQPRKKTRIIPLSLLGFVCLLLLLLIGLVMGPSDNARPPEEKLSRFSERKTLTTAHEVGHQLAVMLKEREMTEQVLLAVSARQVTLNGEVSAEQVALITRMLERFDASFETAVVIVNKVRALNLELPFKIVQIIGGSKAHVVLVDGRRLFFGDEVDGLRLTAIDNHRLVFEGKRRYEVSW